MAVLPSGVNADEFAASLRKFRDAVALSGCSGPTRTSPCIGTYSPLLGRPDELVASAAVAPDTVKQVQAIVRIANEHKLPLYPISTDG